MYVTMAVFITFVIIAFVLGGLLGVFFMCFAIAASESDKASEKYHSYYDEGEL